MNNQIITPRLDIQGLRAIAVLAVVADHLAGWPRGGFVGVDIFFVISGYLITAQLLKLRDRHPQWSVSAYFAEFYRRRVKRILPASLLTLAVTAALAWVWFPAERARTTVLDALWAMLFSGNWRFALNGTDYWAQDTAVSPLQHFWSLGVEEQFYFVWPMVIVLVSAFAGVSADRRRRALLWTMSAIVTISLAWAVLETASNATIAYFSTFTRAWELGVGALLALLAPRFEGWGARFRTSLAWTGLLLIVVSIAVISSEWAFPGPWAVLPVVATALVIAAGTGGESQTYQVLSNPVMVHIGNLSYSVYLWHFPVIIFAQYLMTQWHWSYFVLILAVIYGLSALSYYLIEEPIRSSSWLTRGPSFSWNGWGSLVWPRLTTTHQNVALVALALAAGGSVIASFAAPSPVTPAMVAAADARADLAQSESQQEKTAVSTLQDSLLEAVAADEWPNLNPSIDQVATRGALSERSDGCGEPVVSDDLCNYDEGHGRTIVVYSDSTGIALVSALRQAYGGSYNIRGFAMAGCVSLDLEIKDPRQEHRERCDKYRQDALDKIDDLQPEVVLITNTTGVVGDVVSENGKSGYQAWEAAAERTVTTLQGMADKVGIVTSPPIGRTISSCATQGGPEACLGGIEDTYKAQLSIYQRVVQETGADLVDLTSLYCTDRGACPAFVDGSPIRTDTVHLTRQYVERSLPAFSQLLSESTGIGAEKQGQ